MNLRDIPPPPRQPAPRARDLLFRAHGAASVFHIVGTVFALLGGFFLLVAGFLWLALLQNTNSVSFVFLLSPLPFLGIGITFWLSARLSVQQQIQAFTHGVPIQARVTFLGKNLSARKNRQHPFLLQWTFEAQGKTFRGSYSSFEDLSSFVSDEKVTVLYLPNKPQTNTLYIAD
jgi:hypothetical protein